MTSPLSIIGFLCDHNSSFMMGAAEAPPLIRDALYSDSANLWTEDGIDLAGMFEHAGDVSFDSVEQFASSIESVIRMVRGRHQIPISLGGDHSITFPIVKALASEYPELSILHFDAHPDLYEDFAGNVYSHASPFARIMENRLAKRLVQVGIRTMNGHQ